jgi:hypothetical protein
LPNREARDALQIIKGNGIKNNDEDMDLYLISIDASIKDGNPDRAMIEEGLMLADNGLAILLRSLALKI